MPQPQRVGGGRPLSGKSARLRFIHAGVSLCSFAVIRNMS
jgi:hypothetical protein